MLSWKSPIPGETAKAFVAFKLYRDMDTPGQEYRTQAKVAEALGHTSMTTVVQWVRKNEWKERVRLYDEHMSNRVLTLRDAGLEEYQRSVTRDDSEAAAVAGQIILNELLKMSVRQREGEEDIDPQDINRLLSALRETSNIRRRAASMPTTFRQEQVKELPHAQEVYTVGDVRDD